MKIYTAAVGEVLFCFVFFFVFLLNLKTRDRFHFISLARKCFPFNYAYFVALPDAVLE